MSEATALTTEPQPPLPIVSLFLPLSLYFSLDTYFFLFENQINEAEWPAGFLSLTGLMRAVATSKHFLARKPS